MRAIPWLAGLVLVAAGFAIAPQPKPAPGKPMSDASQIAAALLPLPQEFRASAEVLGYHAGSPKLITLRTGTGPFICLGTDPALNQFHVACYHRSLDPFMLRGRVLREQHTGANQVDSIRYAEVHSGKLAMPKTAAALYQLTGPLGSFDPVTNTAKNVMPQSVIYISGATAESTGLPSRPQKDGEPWIMEPGTPKAHIMIMGAM